MLGGSVVVVHAGVPSAWAGHAHAEVELEGASQLQDEPRGQALLIAHARQRQVQQLPVDRRMQLLLRLALRAARRTDARHVTHQESELQLPDNSRPGCRGIRSRRRRRRGFRSRQRRRGNSIRRLRRRRRRGLRRCRRRRRRRRRRSSRRGSRRRLRDCIRLLHGLECLANLVAPLAFKLRNGHLHRRGDVRRVTGGRLASIHHHRRSLSALPVRVAGILARAALALGRVGVAPLPAVQRPVLLPRTIGAEGGQAAQGGAGKVPLTQAVRAADRRCCAGPRPRRHAHARGGRGAEGWEGRGGVEAPGSTGGGPHAAGTEQGLGGGAALGC
mmetsp:Transcript_36445/g.116082  ORF Transcript_36445/g.116082 Transcript_36445/m.116082 type:complete len:330 (+) Transcript_36445:764-1753(+)